MNNKFELDPLPSEEQLEQKRLSNITDFELLWDRAVAIGKSATLNYNPRSYGDHPKYEVSISIDRASGSYVQAKGSSNDKIEALKTAIGEAIALTDK